MAKFTGFRNAASGILKSFAGNVTIKKISNGSYNTETGSISEQITEVTVKGFLEDVTKSQVDQFIKQTDKRCLVSRGDISFEPTPNDKVTISSINYSIIKVDKEMIEGQDVFYTLYLRA